MINKILLTILTIFIINSSLFAQWIYQNSSLNNNGIESLGAIYPMNNDTVFIIADSAIFLKTYNGGTNWISQNTGFIVHFSDLSFCNVDTGFAVGQSGTIIRTVDGGTNWTSLTSGTSKDLFSISSKYPNNLWVVGDSGIILNSYDYGNTWIKNDTLTNKRLNSICFRNSIIGFIAGNNGSLFGTSNGGLNWDMLNIVTSNDLFSISITDNYLYILSGMVSYNLYMGNELFKTSDNMNWTSSYFSMSLNPSRIYFQNDSLGYVITSAITTNSESVILIDKTTDFGQNWVSSHSDWNAPKMSGSAYSDIVFLTDSLGYALSGNNILKTTNGGILGLKEKNKDTEIKIYPNPNNGTFTITHNLNGKNYVLEIVDLMGKVVHRENIIATKQIVNTQQLSKGLYFVNFKLNTGELMYSTKMSVIN